MALINFRIVTENFLQQETSYVSLQEIGNFLESTDLRFLITKVKSKKYLASIVFCLTALIEHYDDLFEKNRQMWFFSNIRIGNQICLMKDLKILHDQLLARIRLSKFINCETETPTPFDSLEPLEISKT